MKVSYNWIKDFVDIDTPLDEFCEAMTISGTKVEEIIEQCSGITNVVVGHIDEIKEHPNADRLVICSVDVGQEKNLQIVTGAPNVQEGQFVPVALVGSQLAGGLKIKKTKLRGVASEGMLCSLEELGLDKHYFADAVDDGIYVIDPERFDLTLGADACEQLALRNPIIDFEITTNRPDCLSVEGIAREAAATFSQEFIERKCSYDVDKESDIRDHLSVEVKDHDLCPRFIAAMVKDVKIGPSPEWLCQRLRSASVRPINNIVDISNFVMLETGQPLHVYDRRQIVGDKIIVRRAADDKELTTLDGKKRSLVEDSLLICDAVKPIGLAGVMGGLDSEVEDDTKEVVIEAASFDKHSIHQTSNRLNLSTEASQRFERGIPIQRASDAMELALTLIDELSAGSIVAGKIDVHPVGVTQEREREIEFSVDRLNKFLGLELDDAEAISYIERSYCQVRPSDKEGLYLATVPYWRLDLKEEVDLSEELARFYDYNRIPESFFKNSSTLGYRSVRQEAEEKIKNILCAAACYEVQTVSFEAPESMDMLRFSSDDERRDFVEIKNPLGSQMSVLRSTPLPELLRIAARNIARGEDEGAVFELVNTYHPAARRDDRDKEFARAIKRQELLPNDRELPSERPHIAVCLWSSEIEESKDLFLQAKGIIDDLARGFGLSERDLKFIRPQANFEYHPGQSALIYCAEKELGSIGTIHPKVAEAFEVDENCVFIDIYLERFLAVANPLEEINPIPRYPALTRDLAIVAPKEVFAADIADLIYEQGGEYLKNVELFDVYTDEKLGEDMASRAYALDFQSADKSLSDDEINPYIEKIVQALEAKGWSLRY